MELLIHPLSDKIGTAIPLPYYATDGAAALDLHACTDGDTVIPPHERVFIPTGIAVAIPDGYVGIMAVRSSMGARHGINLANGIGVIDSDYRGQLHVTLYNTTEAPYTVRSGDRIAQLMVMPVARPTLKVVDTLPETGRGTGGFGSTGR
ncbi:MAG: dUTP diphosphatase [Oscillospiraceae bacterium]|nr:dUTP diphosphatase [Oscillospiraceae bacterium]